MDSDNFHIVYELQSKTLYSRTRFLEIYKHKQIKYHENDSLHLTANVIILSLYQPWNNKQIEKKTPFELIISERNSMSYYAAVKHLMATVVKPRSTTNRPIRIWNKINRLNFERKSVFLQFSLFQNEVILRWYLKSENVHPVLEISNFLHYHVLILQNDPCGTTQAFSASGMAGEGPRSDYAQRGIGTKPTRHLSEETNRLIVLQRLSTS